MNTLFVGQNYQALITIDSTNTYLKNLTKTHQLAEGYMVSTLYQTLGRGQFGNTWQSQKGENMLLSVLLSPIWLSPAHFFYLNMSVCLSVYDTVEHYINGAQVKWPNDILFGKKKLAGILVENQIMKSGIDQSIVGVGLNVNQDFGNEGNASSLSSILGERIKVEDVIAVFCEKLELRYLKLKEAKDFGGLKQEYLNRLYGYQTPVKVNYNNQFDTIRIVDISEEGILKALSADGSRVSFNFKEVTFSL